MRKGLIKVIGLNLFLFLSACGGGGSNSGGGSAPAPVAPPPIDRTGSYAGSQDWTLTGGGQTSTDTLDFSMSVTGSQVTITEFSVPDPVGPIDANGNFRVFVPFTFTLEDRTPCQGEIAWDGNVGDGMASGNVVGTLTCRGVPVELSGSWEATRSALGKRSSDNGIRALERLTGELF